MSPSLKLEKIRKTQIIEAGLSVIREKGVSGATMNDVCLESGLSKGGLVHYFPSKKVLFRAVFEELFHRVCKKNGKLMEHCDDSVEKIHTLGWLYDDKDPDVYLTHAVTIDFMSLAVHDKGYAFLLKHAMDYWIDLLNNALSQGIKEKFFQPMNTIKIAQSILSVCQGIGIRWFLLKESHPADWAMHSFENAVAGLLIPYRTNMH